MVDERLMLTTDISAIFIFQKGCAGSHLPMHHPPVRVGI